MFYKQNMPLESVAGSGSRLCLQLICVAASTIVFYIALHPMTLALKDQKHWHILRGETPSENTTSVSPSIVTHALYPTIVEQPSHHNPYQWMLTENLRTRRDLVGGRWLPVPLDQLNRFLDKDEIDSFLAEPGKDRVCRAKHRSCCIGSIAYASTVDWNINKCDPKLGAFICLSV